MGGRPPWVGGTHPPLERSSLSLRSVWFAVTGVPCDDPLVISETPGVERRSGRGLPPREKKHHSGRYAFRTRLHRGAGGVYPMRNSRGNRFAGGRKEVRQLHRGVALLARGRYLPAQGRCFHNRNNRGTFGIRSAMAFLGDQPENPTEPHEEAGGGAIPAAAHDPRDGARSPRRRAIPAPRTAPAMGARTPTDTSAGSRSAVRCCGAAAAAA